DYYCHSFDSSGYWVF
nr:immunoglobulin light chain junction region [Macaca mulatta]